MLVFTKWQDDKSKQILSSSMEKFSFSSPERVTKLKKIVVSSAVSQVTINKQYLDNTIKCLEKIADQKPVISKSKKSAFKVREGTPLGCRVTLRRGKMWNFLFKLIHLYIPRVRDLRGMSVNGFDWSGNYNFGISDLTIFHEVPYELTFKNQGLQVNFVFSSKDSLENKYFLNYLGFPFKDIHQKKI